MVKRSLSLVLAASLALSGCGAVRRSDGVRPQVLALGATSVGAEVSLVSGGSSLFVIYADRDSATLRLAQLPVDADLPAAPPAPAVIDRIAEAPPLSPAFGEQVAVTHDGLLSILYLDQHGEDRRILKIASRPLDGGAWTVDALTEPGDPVAALPAGAGTIDVVWAAATLLERPWPGAETQLSLCGPFTADGVASAFSSGTPDHRGFTVWDKVRGLLRLVHWNGISYQVDVVPGGQRTQATVLAPDGTVAVATWDATNHRLYLLEQRPGSATFARSTVTIADEVHSVQILSASPDSGYLVLFDETRSGATGGEEHRLELIEPSKPRGGRYQERTLLTGEDQIETVKAVRTAHSLYVLAFQGGLKLLRLPRP